MRVATISITNTHAPVTKTVNGNIARLTKFISSCYTEAAVATTRLNQAGDKLVQLRALGSTQLVATELLGQLSSYALDYFVTLCG